MPKKSCKNCDKYRPSCRLYGSFDANGKPHVERVVTCENQCADCGKEEE